MKNEEAIANNIEKGERREYYDNDKTAIVLLFVAAGSLIFYGVVGYGFYKLVMFVYPHLR